jgi:hypothetical protein
MMIIFGKEIKGRRLATRKKSASQDLPAAYHWTLNPRWIPSEVPDRMTSVTYV